MNKIIVNSLIALLLLFFTGICLLGFHISKRHSKLVDNSPTIEKMINAKATEYYENGKIKNIVVAKEWINDLNSDNSLLKEPLLTIFKKDGNIWNIRSTTADLLKTSADSGINEIVLSKKVKIIRQPTATKSRIDVSTEKLHYYPNSDNFETNTKVELIQPGLIIQGIGINGNINKENVRILQDVSTTFTPSQKG